MEPAVLAGTYGTTRSTLDKIAIYAESRLRAELDRKATIAIVPRVKELPSVLQKLQTGRYKSFRALEDLAGVKVIVLRRRDVTPAVETIRTAFQVVREKDRVTEPSSFAYREPHLIVKPPADYLDRNPDVAGFVIEVQVTTALQHALDQITHGFDYKPSSLDWGRRRLVAQLRASLELIDNLLDDMEASAQLIHEAAIAPERLRVEQDVLASFIAAFDEADMQPDRRRLAGTALDYVGAARLSSSDLPALLDRHMDLRGTKTLTPLDVLLGALLRERSAELLATYVGRFVVSEEFESLCAEASQIPHARRVSLE